MLIHETRKKNKGITLIALVITIIVLLILAGVSIATLTGDNGLLSKAQEAKEKTEEARRKEEQDLKNIEIQMKMQQNGEIANMPDLKEGMIPVKWNGSAWVKADKENNNKDWYDYSTSSKKWANVVTVKESGTKSREEYKNASVGETIAEDDITTMFVWIPRYSYKITSGYHEKANGTGEIDIKFLIGTTDTPVEGGDDAQRNSKSNENYVVHPAFTSDTNLGGVGEEVTGFWVGKFESSNSESKKNNEGINSSSTDDVLYGRGNKTDVTIRPSVTSWRAIDVNNIYTACDNMNSDGNIHGFGTDTDTTMMKNSQWGAVAYLAQSNYGNKQVSTDNTSGIWNNSYNEGITKPNSSSAGVAFYYTTLTGMVADSRDNSTSGNAKMQEGTKIINEDGSVSITYVTRNNDGTETTPYTKTYYPYYTENGQKGSTTRNIYGVYDMSGGSWEYMASYLENATNSYATNFKKFNTKYQTPYKGTGASSSTEDRTVNYEANKEMYGDAVWETSNGANGGYSWNGDYSYFPFLSSPFFLRGGAFYVSSYAGVFSFSNLTGGGLAHCGFRAVAL